MRQFPGGTLKTFKKQDKESLQAKWWPLAEIRRGNPNLPLRATDMLHLVEKAMENRKAQIKPDLLLPTVNPHKQILLKVIFTWHDR